MRAGGPGSDVLNIIRQCTSNVRLQRKPLEAAFLRAAHRKDVVLPVKVIQFEPNDFAATESVSTK